MSLLKINQENPLIHCITNYVVANFTANGLLAIGASPVMADEIAEVGDMVSVASGLLVNIGTINGRTKEAMIVAGRKANEVGIPVVLDPVGVGATAFRRETVKNLLREIKFDLIRCNTGELAAIAGVNWDSKGVDSGVGEMDIEQTAKAIAKQYNCFVIVTGEVDIATNGESIDYIAGGHELMTKITGTGCLLSAICTAALAVERNDLSILVDVLKDYKKVAEKARQKEWLGTVQQEVLNQLHQIAGGRA
ncbi:hydroxyethylthiazole kinase [Rummeliibacillus sp. TYF-LIM-RU47]|uniref:hydroxyethylthiazole kinase n=1 Tax=Rummeliibacillus sp. TYF-LIM-RU47 TaxID=2608406 RepID=UPI00123974FA|nr:hydroxyethylthiazole kinase [Rummeliibacillus sp. TYF-LIM-RU47]